MKASFSSFLVLGFSLLTPAALTAGNWPGWRGGDGSGISSEKDLPLKWSAKENVRWRVDLPGPGNSSPIVWGDRVFVSQAIKAENRRTVMCFDFGTGKLLWQSGITYTGPEQTQENNPYCAGTPATDGERVYVAFGSPGVYAYDFSGKEVWHRDLGKIEHGFGTAVSPLIHGELCILNFGPGEKARLIALNRKTGATAWETEPPKPDASEMQQGNPGGGGAGRGGPGGRAGGGGFGGGSWSTPRVIQAGGREELVAAFPFRLAGFEPLTGKQLWFSKGIGGFVYTSALWNGETLVAASGGPAGGQAIAVRAGGTGEITEGQRLWRLERVKNAFGSGVVHGGYFYTIGQDGIAECSDLATGKSVWLERLSGTGAQTGSWSSMLLVEDRIYLPNKSGDVFVIRASPKFEVLATNSIGEPTNASLAAANKSFVLRSSTGLWRIGN